MKNRLFISLIAAAWSLASLAPAFAGDLAVTRYFSGLWEQPHQESQGIVLQIIDQEEDGMPKAVAYWFTYGDDLEASWFMAIGHVEGDQVLMELYSSSGAGFMQAEDADLNPVSASGYLNLAFHNCNKGMAEYSIEEGETVLDSGEFEIKRLAGLYNGRCTGGISDNTPGDAKPLMLEVALMPPEGVESDAKGKAKFWERPDRSDFHISTEYLADGLYDVAYCDAFYAGVLEVTDGEGAVQFRSPEAEGKILLTRTPVECRIDVLQGSTVVLTSGESVLGDKVKGPKDKDDGEKMKLELEFENTGLAGYEDAEGEVEYEVSSDETEFEVEVDDMPAGSYDLQVGGESLGTIEVNASGKGKLKFSDPVKEDRLPLPPGFDPMGSTVTVSDAEGIILTVDFPAP